MGQGGPVGGAQGRITIDVSQLRAAQAAVNALAAGVSRSMGGIAPSVNKAQTSVDSLSATFTRLGSAIGISVGIAGAAKLGKFALDATNIATAYARQEVAARSLAGSQSKLNDLLAAYSDATGGVVDKATSLANVINLQATGFADSAGELSKFASAARGIGLAKGLDPAYVISQIQLAINNTSTMRLDQIGIDAAQVTKRIAELRDANKSMTLQMAYQVAILEQADQKFGALGKSAAGQATGVEKATKAWADFKLAFGQATGGTVGGFFTTLATDIDSLSDKFTGLADDIKRARGEWEQFQKDQAGPAKSGGGFGGAGDKHTGAPTGFRETFLKGNGIADYLLRGTDPLGDWLATHQLGEKEGEGLWFNQVRDTRLPPLDLTGPLGSRSGVGANIRQQPTAMQRPGDSDTIRQIHLDWAAGVEALNIETHKAINDEEASFGAARAKTVADYAKSVARDEANYARGRLRANIDFLDSMATAARDATRREAGEASDLARTMATTRADATEQEIKTKEDAGKQLAKIDADYAKNREKAEADHRDKMLDAAGSLDAVALLEERKRWARESADAKSAHDESRKNVEDGLKDQLDEQAKSLAKSLAQQQESYDRSIKEGRENDALQLEDMRAAFAKSQARAAEDHAIEVTQRAEDEADNLKAMDTAHGLRMNQIRTHAIEEAGALQKAADDAAIAKGVADAATQKAHDAREKAEEDLWDKFHKHITDSLTPKGIAGTPNSPRGYASGGLVPNTGLAFLHAGEYVMPAAQVARTGTDGGGFNFSGNVSVTIAGSTNMNEDQLDRAVRRGVIGALKEIRGKR